MDRVSTPDQLTEPWPNVANEIARHLRGKWGDITRTHYAWFTGSSVWSFLYGIEPSPEADLDMFIEIPTVEKNYMLRLAIQANGGQTRPGWEYNHRAILWLEDYLKRDPGYEVLPAKTSSLGGRRCRVEAGKVDYWVCPSDAIQQLFNYPPDSHGHCKAAYSFYRNTLLVIPNSRATPDGEIECSERLMLKYAEKARGA